MTLCGWCDQPRSNPSDECRRKHGAARKVGHPGKVNAVAQARAIAALPEGACPARLDRELHESEVDGARKRDSCAHYESCLDVAAIANWTQWHCDDCGAYEHKPPSRQLIIASLDIARLIV
jgi:hypothetical protein